MPTAVWSNFVGNWCVSLKLKIVLPKSSSMTKGQQATNARLLVIVMEPGPAANTAGAMAPQELLLIPFQRLKSNWRTIPSTSMTHSPSKIGSQRISNPGKISSVNLFTNMMSVNQAVSKLAQVSTV